MEGNGPPPATIIEHKAYARIGLLGNPSDVYHGRTISLNISNFWASVRLEPSSDLKIVPHPTHDLVKFSSLSHLVNRLENEGYYGGVRLLMATCKVFTKYCKEQGINLHNNNFSLSYETNIPRQTGLSGSSAIVCAAFSCLVDFYKVRDKIGVEIRPQLILNAEKELGIAAGLQDRVAQVYGGLLYMDFEKSKMDECGHGIYTQLDTSLLPPLHVIYAENPSDSGKVFYIFWLFGCAYCGPFGHFYHLMLDKLFKGKKDSTIVAKKVLLEQVTSSPWNNLMFMLYYGFVIEVIDRGLTTWQIIVI